MKKFAIILSISMICAALSGCIVVPEHGYYGPAYGGCYHCWH